MDNKVNINLEIFSLLFKHYKKLIIPALVLIASLFIFMEVTLPQIQSLMSLGQATKDANNKLYMLKSNLVNLAGVNNSDLNNQYKTAIGALPASKDFNGILNGLSDASAKSGILLGNYSLNIGDLSQQPDVDGKYLFIKLDLNLSGNIISANNFIKNITGTFPLSQITNIDLGKSGSTVSLAFYYKPLPEDSPSPDSTLISLSPQDLSLLAKLSSFENTNNAVQAPIIVNTLPAVSPVPSPVSSPSAAQAAAAAVSSASGSINHP